MKRNIISSLTVGDRSQKGLSTGCKYVLALGALMIMMLTACIEDGFTTASADQPKFSVDTLDMGETFTLTPTPTRRFTVRNPHSKMLNISSISLRDDDGQLFRLNVDGRSGRVFNNVEIRPNDSIMVFVEATLPENQSDLPVVVKRHLDFVTNGVTRTVVLSLQGQDVNRYDNVTLDADTRFDASKPYLVSGTLTVSEGVTLTIDPGVRLFMHSEARIEVNGTLDAIGTAQSPIELTGDRTGYVAASIPYELMSGQWGGIYFGSTSRNNVMEYVSMRNSSDGLTLDAIDSGDEPALTAINCQIRNTTNHIVDANHANVRLIGCELTDASQGLVRLVGGKHNINHCTLANYYLFTAIGGPAIDLIHFDSESDDESGLEYGSLSVTNSIIYGFGSELSHRDLTGMNVIINRCILRSSGDDDDNFINCLWDTDPLYYTVRMDYLFDYRVQPESPAIGAADASLDVFGLQSDRYGEKMHQPADLGAYVFVMPDEQ